MASTALRLLLIAFLMAFPSVVWADAILLADTRLIQGAAQVDAEFDSYAHFATFGLPFSMSDSANVTVGSATASGASDQTSIAGPLLFDVISSATSSVNADQTLFNRVEGFGVSSYRVDFQLNEPHTYIFSASVDADGVPFNPLAVNQFANASLFSFDIGELHGLSVSNTTDSLNASGTLTPGLYQLLFQASTQTGAGALYGISSAVGNASSVGSLTLAPINGVPPPVIPEPTTIVLVTSGLVGMGVRQLRKRRSR